MSWTLHPVTLVIPEHFSLCQGTLSYWGRSLLVGNAVAMWCGRVGVVASGCLDQTFPSRTSVCYKIINVIHRSVAFNVVDDSCGL